MLYINDEYGVSIYDVIQERAKEEGIPLVSVEPFDVGTTDFRTHLTKIKSTDPEALLFVGAVPPELINALKQTRELDIEADFFEASALLSLKTMHSIDGAEGALTNAFSFSLGQTGSKFRKAYEEAYNEEPFFAAAFGYDTVMLAAEASRGKSLPGKKFVKKIHAIKEFESLNGLVTIQKNGEINPPMYQAKIVNGNLIQTI